MGLTNRKKVFLISAFLVTGSINTLTRKFQFETCAGNSFPYVEDTQISGVCSPGTKLFHKPWTQNVLMFIGETFLLTVFFQRTYCSSKYLFKRQDISSPFYIFLFPACCDVVGNGLGGVGMLYISAAAWQMLRGSLIVFTSVLSVVFLGRRLYAYNWAAVIMSVFGLVLVGVSVLLDDEREYVSVSFGIVLTIISQFFTAFQCVLEELLVKRYQCAPEQVVGYEGAWGVCIMVLVLAVMYEVPGSDSGSYENVVDSISMVADSHILFGFVLLYLISISLFKFLGVAISGNLTSLHRTMNDALRTAFVWVAQLVLYYAGSETYGVGLKRHSWMQLLGFILLVVGSLVNHTVVRLPFFYYPQVTTNSFRQLSFAASPAIETAPDYYQSPNLLTAASPFRAVPPMSPTPRFLTESLIDREGDCPDRATRKTIGIQL